SVEIGRIVGRLVRPLGCEFVVVGLGHDHDAFGDPVGGLEDFPFRIDRVENVTHAGTASTDISHSRAAAPWAGTTPFPRALSCWLRVSPIARSEERRVGKEGRGGGG